jgi:hypothetical protein
VPALPVASSLPVALLAYAMRSKPTPIDNFLVSHVMFLLRLAGLVSIASGLIGGFVWLVALVDRSDGDDLRWGFFHNPFMQFRPFNETFLDISMWVLLACSAAVGLGGLMLLVSRKWGVPLVTWQACVSIMTNSVIAFSIVAMTFGLAKTQLEEEALVLRLGSIVVDLMLWTFLSSNAVREFFARQSRRPERAFEVIIKEPLDQADCGVVVPAADKRG